MLPQNLYAEVLILSTLEYDCMGDRAFNEMIKLK